jgi:hypothetical protein
MTRRNKPTQGTNDMQSLKFQLHLFTTPSSYDHEISEESRFGRDVIDIDLTYACTTRDEAVKVAADMARGIIKADQSQWVMVEVVEEVGRNNLHVIAGFTCMAP